ncbi:amidohydrolase family protein [Halobacillus litoralis]|uniref:Amidohydrolase-related domain-containing protein n=1 Tax=Halobacillus litoralis TaxID=45668 RepID=A0A410MC26_9BACI|nr:amidohydrolase family protein [Halobacillus litoralis]QAS52205.1 hypothetical protein HLI_08165 [Halobacillus litoralis]
MSTVIENAEWISPRSGGVKRGNILIKEGKIEKILPSGTSPDNNYEAIDATGQLIIPGMTNAHYHSYSNLLKGTEHDLPLEVWSLYTVAYGHSLSDEDIYLAVLLGAIEMIRSGVTGCIDHFPHLPRSQAALEAYHDSGMHVSFAPMMHDVPDHHFLKLKLPVELREKLESVAPRTVSEMHDFYHDLIRNWHTRDGRIHIILGPNAPQRCSFEALDLCSHLSEEFDLKVHTHLLETLIQRDLGKVHYDGGMLAHMQNAGILNERLSVAHAIWLEVKELDLLKGRGVSVIHNPGSNMTLGSGKAPIAEFLQRGIPVGLGTDASNCGTSHSLFETMRFAAMMHRVDERAFENWPKASQTFEMATVHGANIMGYGNRRGEIREGYDADLVFLRKNTTTWSNIHDEISQLVFHENGQSIESVMIRGEWVLRNNRITAFNEQQVIERVQERAEALRINSREAVGFADRLRPYVESFYNNFYNGRK